MISPAAQSLRPARADGLDRLALMPRPDVMILGGGVNGVATLRDLALNGVPAILLDTGDFCAGASGASSRMAHGGLRYLEGREFRLVAESARERNLLLRDAPHLVHPLEIVVPLRNRIAGFGGSVARFLGLSRRQGPLNLAALVGALGLYEAFGIVRRSLPRPTVTLSRKRFPDGLSAEVAAVASYHDGQIAGPEALVFEMLAEATAQPHAVAVNHVRWTREGGAFRVTDPATGREIILEPRVVVNASGAAIDRVNAALGEATGLVRGVKGAHLVLRHPEFHARLAGRAFYFDDGTGRMVICLPVGGCILFGTTEVETSEPGDRAVAEGEVDYLIAAAQRLFRDIEVGRHHIVALTSGIRPLQAGDGNATQAARDHALVEHVFGGLPVVSLVGGKWTTFRSFAEQATDRVLALLGRLRTVSTADRPYPGAVPLDAAAVADATGLPVERVEALRRRYGGLAGAVAFHCGADADTPLRHAAGYSRREIEWLVHTRMAMTLDDLVLRRTDLVFSSGIARPVLDELAVILGATLGRDAAWQRAQVASCLADPRILFETPALEAAE